MTTLDRFRTAPPKPSARSRAICQPLVSASHCSLQIRHERKRPRGHLSVKGELP
jgi:hypothetical protein